MSQSDYLKYKRVATLLKVDNTTKKQPPVFESQTYVNNKEFALENTIVNTKLVLNRLTPTGRQAILGMDKLVGNCATFPVCKNTHLRTNRVPMSDVYYTPTPQPLNIIEQDAAVNLKRITAATCDCIA